MQKHNQLYRITCLTDTSCKATYKIDTIFMNSENSKTSELRVLILKLTNKLDVKTGEKIIAIANFSIYYMWKNIKN